MSTNTKQGKLPIGNMVRITGGILADPEGNGIGYAIPGPVPKELIGTLGQLVKFDPVHGVNLPGVGHPFEPYRTQLNQRKIKEIGEFSVIEIFEGPLKGALVNPDLVEFDILSPLEALGL